MVESLEGEIWKDIPGYEGSYQVSNMGRIKTLERSYPSGRQKTTIRHIKERLLNQRFFGQYITVSLTKNGIVSSKLVHRCVCQAFLPNPLNKPEVNHINGVKNDNRLENLEWVTSKENFRHAIETGLFVYKYRPDGLKGSKNGASKIKDDDVREIRKIWEQKKYTAAELGRQFGICKNSVYNIVRRHSWSHII